MADFSERMAHLVREVGAGKLTARCSTDQVYARYQEVRDDLVLHGGGQHHFQRDALYDNEAEIMQTWADGLLTADGSDLKSATIECAEKIAAGVYEKAPFEFGDLKGSPSPSAEDNGAEYYHRAPAVHRLTEDELRAKGDLRRLGFGNARGPALNEALGNLA